jgi:starch synthase (maltosyl-transferring)
MFILKLMEENILCEGVVGEIVEVEADIFADGHDIVHAQILYRHESEKSFNRP